MFPDYVWLPLSSIDFKLLGVRRLFRKFVESPYTRANSVGSEQKGVALTRFFGRDALEHGQNTHGMLDGGERPAPYPARRCIRLGLPAPVCTNHTWPGVNQGKIRTQLCETVEHQRHHGCGLIYQVHNGPIFLQTHLRAKCSHGLQIGHLELVGAPTVVKAAAD